MKTPHQIVKIRIDVTRDTNSNPIYTASNEELGVFVRGTSFREVLLDLRETLALRLKHHDLSLHFYSGEVSQESRPGVLPPPALTPQASRETHIS